MFVVLRISRVDSAVLSVTVIGVFAQEVDAKKCERTDRRRCCESRRNVKSQSLPFIVGKSKLGDLDLDWKVQAAAHQNSDWHPNTGDPVYVLTHAARVLGCASTQQELHTTLHGSATTSCHILKFGMYKPGIMAHTQMFIDDSVSDTEPPKNKLVL